MARGIKTGGRQKGTPNKVSGQLKDAILEAAKRAGGGDQEGVIKYLQAQALANPAPFLSLIGKVLPMQVTGEDGGPVIVEIKRFAP